MRKVGGWSCRSTAEGTPVSPTPGQDRPTLPVAHHVRRLARIARTRPKEQLPTGSSFQRSGFKSAGLAGLSSKFQVQSVGAVPYPADIMPTGRWSGGTSSAHGCLPRPKVKAILFITLVTGAAGVPPTTTFPCAFANELSQLCDFDP